MNAASEPHATGMAALRTGLAGLGRELASNARLRLGVYAVLVLLLLYWLLARGPQLAQAAADYAAAAERLDRAEALLAAADWQPRLAAARSANAALDARFWDAETPAQAQAQLRKALADAAASAGVYEPRLQAGVGQAVPEAPGLWRAQVRLAGSYESGGELRLLHGLATHRKRIVLDRLDLTPGRTSRLLLLASAYFVGVAAEPADGAAE